jgi:hypothetical protein
VPSKLKQVPPSSTTIQPVALQPSLQTSDIFGDRHTRILRPCDLPGPKMGLDRYYVVICGQEVGIFYSE